MISYTETWTDKPKELQEQRKKTALEQEPVGITSFSNRRKKGEIRTLLH